MATLKDVAAAAGVSVATVSLVLNGRDAGRVKATVSERVRQAAAELGYAPNLLARSLKTRQTHTIGLISDSVASTPFAGRMLAGAQDAAWAAGSLLVLIDTGGHSDMEDAAVQALVQRDVDALIYASMYHRVVELPTVPQELPLVVLDGRPAGEQPAADWVVPDEHNGARAAVTHLIEAGHDRIGFILVDEDIPAVHERLAGYRQALEDHELPYIPELVVRAPGNDARMAVETAHRLLSRQDRPTAVFCFSDRVAMGVFRAARHLDLSIPGDVSVVGFDDQENVADSLEPELTTVALPHYDMGSWAAKRVLARVEEQEDGGEQRHMLMPCPLVIRQSVAPPHSGYPGSATGAPAGTPARSSGSRR
ncbi:substrate-binding domain-containing protein [Phytoactinopolyspora mesophila]|uniref:LacI family DNA-binding transcriptional regulator n=1 Tax=Phytoactinopolyspora mesophila TaxID=2650750 RepID=A0A7K3MA43_9ACTN|nr:LacI family DNA-binding transcriptional regulator [Phytoactinopolyspora mesophila]